MNKVISVISVIGVLVLLSGCAPSGNATACGSYAAAYNELADAVAAGEDRDGLLQIMDDMDLAIDKALLTATGEVRVQITASRDAVILVVPTDTGEAGINFFYSTTRVASACSDSGNPINLHDLK